jgi:hypothetical protein
LISAVTLYTLPPSDIKSPAEYAVAVVQAGASVLAGKILVPSYSSPAITNLTSSILFTALTQITADPLRASVTVISH